MGDEDLHARVLAIWVDGSISLGLHANVAPITRRQRLGVPVSAVVI